MRTSARRLALFLIVAALVPNAGRADDDEDIIIIIDDDEAEEAKGTDPSSDEDGAIILIEDEAEPGAIESPPAEVSGALGRLWETWHVAADSDLLGTVQLVPPEDGPWRLLGSVWLESGLLPAPNLSFHGSAFGRLAIDATPTGRMVPFADLYEAYAKINVDRAVVLLGRLVLPWGRTQGAALGDRVNPPDLRRGDPFPDPARQKQPAWGGALRTSVGSVGMEGVVLVQYEPTEGSLAASNQGGLRLARYQTALVRSPGRAGGLLAADDTSSLRPAPTLGTATLAGRAWRRIGDIDVSGSVVWGFDETPRLRLRPDIARALASELSIVQPLVADGAPLSCGEDVSLACIGGSGTLRHARTTSFSLDASWGLGIVIIRAEAVAYPDLGVLGGKTAIVADELGLRSETLSQYALALAVEGSLGGYIDGSLELFDVIWTPVPASSWLWGVEPFSAQVEEDRVVHRVAVAASLGGALLADRLGWRLRGEAGVLQPDVLVSAEVRYRLPLLNLYVGGRTDVFTGVAGSPGWFRQDSSLVGVFIGEGS